MKLGYCGFYRWHVVIAGYGDSMVAVHDEVGIPDLVELDRRQVLASLKRPPVYALPPLPTFALAGRKARSKSLHRPTLPTISPTSTTLVPR